MKIRFAKSDISEGLIISSGFVDEHMISANGEFVKVYLYLARHAGREVEPAEVADALHVLESDVRRALRYWSTKGVLTVEEVSESESSSAPSFLAAAETPAENSFSDGAETPAEPDLNKLSNDGDFAALLYCSQKALSKIFAQTDVQRFAYLYDVLGMPANLLEYLVEECAKIGKTSVRYIETVAIDWHKRGIDSVAKAKAMGETIYSSEEYSVMRALGLSSRLPVEEERAYIRKWRGEFAFSMEIILEACRRNIMRISQPSFSYVDSILKRWFENGVKTVSDIAPLDARHEETKRRVSDTAVSKNNKFNAFPQREHDLDKHMENKLPSWLSKQKDLNTPGLIYIIGM